MRRTTDLAPGGERDRVLDAVRAVALLVVVAAHALAWDVSSGTPRNVLDGRPDLVWATWLVQTVPLLFAAGAVANAVSWHQHPRLPDFLHRRVVRLLTPALVYTGTWTALLLPLAAVVPEAVGVGRFLSQLLWFLGVYVLVVLAVPWTSRWTGRPWLVLGAWLALVAVVDALRWNVAEAAGWLNLLLVWGFCHQLGYSLPVLRAAPARRLLVGGLVSLGAAGALAVLGPWSSSLVSYAGDPEPSNLSPPTVVVALYGLAQVLLLAALWPWLQRRLASDRLYVVVAGVGTRGLGLYLWHIPVVALVAGTALVLALPAAVLGPVWWGLHAAGLALVLGTGWLLAGAAGRLEARLRTAATARYRGRHVPPATVLGLTTAGLGLVVLHASVTGFGTWWGAGMLGLPSSSVLIVVLLASGWSLLARPPEAAPPSPATTGGVPARNLP